MQITEESNTRAAVSPIARRLVPSIADMFFVLIFLMVLSLGNSLMGTDTDTAWHIRTGDYILSQLEVPKTDIFSYRKYGETWIAHEWLADVIFSFLHRFSGLNGVVAVSAFVIAFTFFLLYKLLESHRLNILVVTAVTALAAITSSIHWLARPHLFSMCLTAVCYLLLQSHQRSPRRIHLLLFPLLMAFWVNLHGGYVAGFVLIGIYAIGNGVAYLISSGRDAGPTKKLLGSTFGIGLLSGLAALLNPYGYRLLLFPFEILGSRVAMENILEWQSPSFHQFTAFEFYLLSVIVVFILSNRKVTVIELGITLFSIHLSLVGQRYIPIFAILMAPILAVRLEDLWRAARNRQPPIFFVRLLQTRINESISRLESMNRNLSGHVYPAVLSLVMIAALCNGGRAFGQAILDYKFEGSRYPIRAVEFIKQNSLSGNMYNSYVFGGYLIYSFFPDPRYRVFVDGRAIVGDESYFVEALKVSELTPEWQKILDRYKVDWMIVETNSVLTVFLFERPEWKLVYSDDVASIFVKETPENSRLIEESRTLKPAYSKAFSGQADF